jgi:hypothetical protein
MITSGGKRNPAKLDLDADTRRGLRRRIDQVCLILLSTHATVPLDLLNDEVGPGAGHRPTELPGSAQFAAFFGPPVIPPIWSGSLRTGHGTS